MTTTYKSGVEYAEKVVAGDIVANKYVIAACRRFISDLQRTDWEWKFDPECANDILAFIELGTKHIKGPLAGELIKVEPWQAFCLINIYGWVNDKGIRRFQYVILEVARKNGKSLFASAMALYEMIFGEEGGEIYSLATKRDQAKIAWEGAVQMAHKAPSMVSDKFKATQSALVNESNWTKYVPLGRDSKSLDGLNPSLNIFDEAAAYSDRNLVDVMTSATGARDNFMHLFITTAQFTRQTVYYENRMYMASVLEGRFDDDRWFGAIYTLDDEDDWTDPSVWIKANPNLGVSVKKEYLETEVAQATQMPAKRNSVLVKHFNIFTTSSENWMSLDEWERCTVDKIQREGDLYITMDLSTTRDLTALCYFWNNGEHFSAAFQCFLPRRTMEIIPVNLRSVYLQAIESGVLKLTDGDIIDYHEVRDHILHMASKYRLKAVGYDKFNANLLVNELEDNRLPCIEIGQNITALSPAAKEAERLIVNGLIKHEKDPFIDWQLENCTIYTDANENIKVRKGDDETLKIDAIIALIMAVSMAAGELKIPGDFDMTIIDL